MPTRFRHAALIGKYQAQGIRPMLESIAQFLLRQGLEVSLERETAMNIDWMDHGALTPAEMGAQCDFGVVVGGDGTMLGIAREMAPFNLPLVGINQGRLGFITDIPIGQFRDALAPMVAELISSHLGSLSIDASAIRRLWLHQANGAMNEWIARKVFGRDLTTVEAPSVLDTYANTSSCGSIITFHKFREGLASGDTGVICSFGAGYSAGSVVVRKV